MHALIAAIGLVFTPPATETQAMDQANGTFTVTMEPQEETAHDGATFGRMSLAKTFEGGLSGSAEGEMLTVISGTPGSAAYVAAERFEGTLEGRLGSFAMTHRGVMAAGDQALVVEIVPDTGTGALTGISGSMSIDIRDGAHFYTLDYSLPD